MEISAKTEYAVRAMLEMAQRYPDIAKVDSIVTEQQLPRKFVQSILSELRRGRLVRSHRGFGGGYSLARPASEITIGDIVRVVDGPLAEVHGVAAHEVTYGGVAQHLTEVWVALRASLRSVLDETSLQDVLTGELPPSIRKLTEPSEAWLPR